MLITVTITRKLSTVDHSKRASVQYDTQSESRELLEVIQKHIAHYCKIELERK